MTQLADGTEIDRVFQRGTRVRHKSSGLTGRIRQLEWNKPGVLSAIPYAVDWDNDLMARERHGILRMYQLHDSLEEIT